MTEINFNNENNYKNGIITKFKIFLFYIKQF